MNYGTTKKSHENEKVNNVDIWVVWALFLTTPWRTLFQKIPVESDVTVEKKKK